LHPNQAELVVGDQSGVIHLWDLKTDHNEQLVGNVMFYFGSVQVATVARPLAECLTNHGSFPEYPDNPRNPPASYQLLSYQSGYLNFNAGL